MNTVLVILGLLIGINAVYLALTMIDAFNIRDDKSGYNYKPELQAIGYLVNILLLLIILKYVNPQL